MYLRQSTTVTIQVGPYLDATDGVSALNALTPTVQVSKSGAAFAARNSATAISFDADGFYRVELSTTDTNTLGILKIKSFAGGAVPVWDNYQVLPQSVYDALVAGSSSLTVLLSVGTGTGQVNLSSGAVPITGDLSATMKASVNTEADTALSDYGALKPTVPTRTLDVSATGEAGIDLANVGSPTTTLNLSGTTVKAVTDRVTANTDQIEGSDATNQIRDSILSDATRFAGANIDVANSTRASQGSVDAVAGYIDTEVGAIKTQTDKLNFTGTDVKATLDGETVTPANGSITAAVIAAGAIDADALATDAVTEIITAVAAIVIEGTITLQQVQRLILSALAGKAMGAATTEMTFRNTLDTKDRIVATVDEFGNRSAVVLDLT